MTCKDRNVPESCVLALILVPDPLRLGLRKTTALPVNAFGLEFSHLREERSSAPSVTNSRASVVLWSKLYFRELSHPSLPNTLVFTFDPPRFEELSKHKMHLEDNFERLSTSPREHGGRRTRYATLVNTWLTFPLIFRVNSISKQQSAVRPRTTLVQLGCRGA